MVNSKRRLLYWYQYLRILKYRILSDSPNIQGSPVINQPVLFAGKGKIIFHGTVQLGNFPSPYFLSGYIFIEARNEDSVIEIGDGVWINNNSVLWSVGPGIYIGNKSTLGTHCEIIDSDFHETHPDRRHEGAPNTGRVIVEDNVMISSNTKILRGVRIGTNSVIANGSVVTRSIPANTLAFGNPAKGGPLQAFTSVAKTQSAANDFSRV